MQLYVDVKDMVSRTVQVALKLKRIPYDLHDLEELQRSEDAAGFLGSGLLSPESVVLLLDGRRAFVQPLAVVEYLDDTFPARRLIPVDARGRARVQALAQIISCTVQSRLNRRVIEYLVRELAFTPEQERAWFHHWFHEGLRPVEANLRSNPVTGRFCHGDDPCLADACLAPVVQEAERHGVDLQVFPTLGQIHRNCMQLEEFAST